MVCPHCGKLNWNGTPLCEFCGRMLMALSRDVRDLTQTYAVPPGLRQSASAQSASPQSAVTAAAIAQILDYPEPRRDSLQEGQFVTLALTQTGHRVTITPHRHVTFGRADPTAGWQPTIDLGPYRGKELGVSRIHADLYFEESQVFLLELGSSNGTQVNGCHVQVGVPRQIRDGDEIALSRLLMRVYFEKEKEPGDENQYVARPVY